MELFKAGLFLLIAGLIILAGSAALKGAAVYGKIGMGLGQVVVVVALLIIVAGGVRALF